MNNYNFDASDIFVPTSNEEREQWIREEEERRLGEPGEPGEPTTP